MNNSTQTGTSELNDLTYHFKNFETQLLNSQTQLCKNDYAFKAFEWQLEKLNQIKKIVFTSPRFDWLKIQFEMDRLYNIDQTITGYHLHFDFKDAILPRRAYIKYKTYNHQQ